MGMGTYDFRKNETVPGLLFTSHRTCYDANWPDDDSIKFANLATDIEFQVNGVVALRPTHHYYGQVRQPVWIDNKCCLLGEQEMGNPQNTYTFNNSHSCALLPLVRRSPVSRIKDSTPNTRNTWWLASRDAYFANQFDTYTISFIMFNFGNSGEDYSFGVVSDTFLKITQIYNIYLED